MSNPNDPDFIPSKPDALVVEAVTPAPVSSEQHRSDILREVLPACQPQEGSPANTFTDAELQELQAQLTDNLKEQLNLKPAPVLVDEEKAAVKDDTKLDIRDLCWCAPSTGSASAADTTKNPREEIQLKEINPKSFSLPRTFREAVRAGQFASPTNGVCPGYLQCNMVVLPAGKMAFDFLLFCQRNSKACPLLEVCEGAMSHSPRNLAEGVDLRTDIPKYAIYRNGKLQEEVTDCTAYWPENAVSFLIGCSFSYDGALQEAGIPLRSAEAGQNVPMYKTNIACEPAGSLQGFTVVSMKPIPCTQVAKEVEITSKYTHAHGGPVCVGCPSAIGIRNMDEPEWGDAIPVREDEIPVFHACGVTPQAVLMDSKVPFAITHSAGHMFVTDRPSDMGVL